MKISAEAMVAKVERIPESGCWLWMAGMTTQGYGAVYDDTDRKVKGAHRVSYELLRGPIPPGLDIDHLCRVRCCVNPEHLEPVTRKVNINRGIVAQVHRARYALVTHCPAGHAYDEKNTYVNRNGARSCRACARERRPKRKAECAL